MLHLSILLSLNSHFRLCVGLNRAVCSIAFFFILQYWRRRTVYTRCFNILQYMQTNTHEPTNQSFHFF